MANNELTHNPITILYDHDCPACRVYVTFTRIQQHLNDVVLINARDTNHPLVLEAKQRGLDLNTGFVVVVGDQFYHGADAMHTLALLGSSSSFLSKLHYWIFRSPARSRFLYPLLAIGRVCLLKLLGKRPIE